MGNHNRFGATAANVIAKYTVGTYTPSADDFGGTTVIEQALDSYTWEVEQALTPRVFANLTEPDLQLVERRATSGQTTVTLGFLPVITGKTHIWVGQPAQFQDRPMLITDPRLFSDGYGSRSYVPSSNGAMVELSSTLFSVVVSTGVVTLSTALNQDDVVYASYQVDTESVDFSVPSLADMVETGAAAEIGSKVYPRGDSAWQLVSTQADNFARGIERLSAGTWIPSELRLARWWQEIEKVQTQTVGSVKVCRG
jgi:hypothetical protein